MLKKTLLTAGLVIGLAAPAFAASCPMDMKAIDDAMSSAQLSDEDKAKVMSLRAKGEEQHNSGDHAGSVQTLGEAKKMLGIGS